MMDRFGAMPSPKEVCTMPIDPPGAEAIDPPGAGPGRTAGRVRVEPGAKRVRALVSGHVVVDSTRPAYVWEVPYFPAYYLPRTDVAARLEPSGRHEHSPSRGDATYFDVHVGDRVVKDAAWTYPESPIEALRDLVRFDWEAMDECLEEDEPVYVHPRSPYTRVDVLASSRRVRIVVDGVSVAASDQPRILFETGLPARYYLPLGHVRTDLLAPSTAVTRCPYKGTATYWNLVVNGHLYEDAVWIYRSPLPESAKIAGLACFYNERVDLYVDEALEPKPRTPFS
jgi:uncharacterized protein (DUF427 family)